MSHASSFQLLRFFKKLARNIFLNSQSLINHYELQKTE